MGRVDSVERNLEKRVFSTNFLVFFERDRDERERDDTNSFGRIIC